MRFRCDTDGVLTDRDDERHGAGPDGERTVVPGNEASCWTAVATGVRRAFKVSTLAFHAVDN